MVFSLLSGTNVHRRSFVKSEWAAAPTENLL